MKRRVLVSAFVVLAAAAACGDADTPPAGPVADAGASSSSGSSGGSSSSSSSSGGDAGSAPELTVDFGSITLDPGQEKTACITKRLGNAGAAHAGKVRTEVVGDVRREIIVYLVDDATEVPTPTECAPFVSTRDPGSRAITISQRADDTVALPAGHGFELAADQMVRIELHVANEKPAPAQVTAKATLTTIASSPAPRAVSMLLFGNPDIEIPANQGSISVASARIPEGNLIGLSGRQRRFGKKIELTINRTDLYISTNWETPALVFFDARAIAKGDRIEIQCSWNNTSDAVVRNGNTFADETCFVRAYYAPAIAAQHCLYTAQAGDEDVCCPSDHPLCK